MAKINADGTGYVWSTYIGGTAQDEGHGIAVDGTGKVYVTGGTNSSDFPMKNAYQDSYPDSGTGEAVFVTKIASDGSSILYSTYLLGYNNNEGHAIAVDDEGNAYGMLARAYEKTEQRDQARVAYTRGIEAAQRHGHPSMAEEYRTVLSTDYEG